MRGLRRLCAAIVLTVPMAANADLIMNGGFETGDLTDWSCTDADLCLVDNFAANTGSFGFRGFDNNGFATLSQAIDTVIGATYDFSFFSFANVDDDGNVLRYQIGSGAIVDVVRTAAHAQTAASFTASSVSTVISFFFETDPGTGTWQIDDVSVTEAVRVPEPGTLALLAAGILGFAFARRRRSTALSH